MRIVFLLMQNLVDCSDTCAPVGVAVATQRPVAEASSLSATRDSHLRLAFLLCSSSVQVGETDCSLRITALILLVLFPQHCLPVHNEDMTVER
jgi:hypothetical protein